MFCPDSGKENPAGQKFCRSCGLSLKPISQALAGEVSPTNGDQNSMVIAQTEKRFWNNPFIYGLLLIVFGMIIGIVGNKMVSTQ